MLSVVGFYRQQDLVGGGQNAVVVFVPDDNDGVVPLLPDRGVVDGVDQRAQGEITLVNQGGIQADLGAVVRRIKIAQGAGIPAAMLVVALIGDDEGKIREISRVEVI